MRLAAREEGVATVSVAVLNQGVPFVRTRSEARVALLRAADLILSFATSSPGLDLLVFPRYGIHGAEEASTRGLLTEPDEEIEALGRACREAGIWVAAPVSAVVTGGADRRPGMVLMNDRGQATTWLDARSRTVGELRSRVVDGPRGLRTTLAFADGARLLRDPNLAAAELIIQHWSNPGTAPSQLVQAARGLAWSNTCFVVSANAVGRVGHHCWSGYSSLVNHDGSILGLCEDLDYEFQHAQLAVHELRRARLARARASRATARYFRRCSAPSRVHPVEREPYAYVH